ncbi:hypothetical protein LINPERPRIM_LOCUS13427 [Linum perenne]
MHQSGIEPRSVPWQGIILPLDHWWFLLLVLYDILHIVIETSKACSSHVR